MHNAFIKVSSVNKVLLKGVDKGVHLTSVFRVYPLTFPVAVKYGSLAAWHPANMSYLHLNHKTLIYRYITSGS